MVKWAWGYMSMRGFAAATKGKSDKPVQRPENPSWAKTQSKRGVVMLRMDEAPPPTQIEADPYVIRFGVPVSITLDFHAGVLRAGLDPFDVEDFILDSWDKHQERASEVWRVSCNNVMKRAIQRVERWQGGVYRDVSDAFLYCPNYSEGKPYKPVKFGRKRDESWGPPEPAAPCGCLLPRYGHEGAIDQQSD